MANPYKLSDKQLIVGSAVGLGVLAAVTYVGAYVGWWNAFPNLVAAGQPAALATTPATPATTAST